MLHFYICVREPLTLAKLAKCECKHSRMVRNFREKKASACKRRKHSAIVYHLLQHTSICVPFNGGKPSVPNRLLVQPAAQK